MLLKEFCQELGLTKAQLTGVPKIDVNDIMNGNKAYDALEWAAEHAGPTYVAVMKHLLAFPKVREVIQEDGNRDDVAEKILTIAARRRDLAMVKCLSSVPEAICDPCGALYSVCCDVRDGGDVDETLAVIDYLLTLPKTLEEIRREISRGCSYTLLGGVASGNIKIMEKLCAEPLLRTRLTLGEGEDCPISAAAGYSDNVAMLHYLLQFPEVMAKATANSEVLWHAFMNNHGDDKNIDYLLTIPRIRATATLDNNEILNNVIEVKHNLLLQKLLTIPEVKICAHLPDNRALKIAVTKHKEAAVRVLLEIENVRMLAMRTLRELIEPERKFLVSSMQKILLQAVSQKANNAEMNAEQFQAMTHLCAKSNGYFLDITDVELQELLKDMPLPIKAVPLVTFSPAAANSHTVEKRVRVEEVADPNKKQKLVYQKK